MIINYKIMPKSCSNLEEPPLVGVATAYLPDVPALLCGLLVDISTLAASIWPRCAEASK